MRSCCSASFHLVMIVASVHLFPVFLRVEGSRLNLQEFLESNMQSVRVKRIVDRPPKPKTTEPPLTSEERMERASGTESPHVYDYPDAIYKNEEMRKGEWNGNPIAKKKSQQYTKVEEYTSKPETKTKKASGSNRSKTNSASPLGSVFGKVVK